VNVNLRQALEWGGIAALALAAYWLFTPAPAPTLAQYVQENRADIRGVIKSGTITLAGVKANCDNTPIVLDDGFGDHAAAWPQSHFIIVNRKYMDPLPRAQQLFTFYHECGHIRGRVGELEADCHGIKEGVRLGWLDEKGLKQLCAYWRPKKGDAIHPPGRQRCNHMIACFKQASR